MSAARSASVGMPLQPGPHFARRQRLDPGRLPTAAPSVPALLPLLAAGCQFGRHRRLPLVRLAALGHQLGFLGDAGRFAPQTIGHRVRSVNALRVSLGQVLGRRKLRQERWQRFAGRLTVTPNLLDEPPARLAPLPGRRQVVLGERVLAQPQLFNLTLQLERAGLQVRLFAFRAAEFAVQFGQFRLDNGPRFPGQAAAAFPAPRAGRTTIPTAANRSPLGTAGEPARFRPACGALPVRRRAERG